MRLLIDAVLPESTASEAPAGVTIVRFSESGVSDEELLRIAARDGYRAAVLFDRSSLSQPGLRQLARELGVGLVAVQADDPVEAKERLLLNLDHLRQALASASVVLVLASEARPLGDD